MHRGCPLCGAGWAVVAPEGYTCPRHGLFTREELANRPEAGTSEGEEDPYLSASTRDGVQAERNEGRLRFRSARDLAESLPEEVEWIARPMVIRGALTELDGKVKTSGKTTLVTHMVRCITEGLPFLGFPTLKTSVVYLTEQGDASFREALKRAALLESDNLFLLPWKDTVGVSWRDVVAAGVEECDRRNAGLLVVDTLPQFAGIEGDGENSSGQALQAIQPLKLAADSHDLAVLFTRHERKSGGDVGDSGRGSSAFPGAADLVYSLRRPEGNASPNLRVLHGIGRFDGVLDSLVIELTEGGYRALGSEEALGVYRAREVVLDRLPRGEANAITIDDLVAEASLSRTSLQTALKALVEEGEVLRCGSGSRGSAYRYYLP